MNENMVATIAIAIMAIVTMLLRGLPFILFNEKRKTPEIIVYLGEVLPEAIIAMLVIYCLRNTHLFVAPFGLPEIISCAIVMLLQYWKDNIILSIIGGTAIYMVLIQLVF